MRGSQLSLRGCRDMAGSYMDAPASRLAYDRDGSIGVLVNASGSITQLSPADLISMNDEGEAGVALTSRSRFAVVFPLPVDIYAVFVALSGTTVFAIETSQDTTTGMDGTWTTQVPYTAYQRDVRPFYRIRDQITDIPPGPSRQGVRGVRVSAAANVSNHIIRALHIYASPSASVQDRLSFRLPGSDAEIGGNFFDWGNVPRGSSADLKFRIKNLSSALTAVGVSLYPEALTAGVPSVAGMMLLSVGGSSFMSSLDLGDLAPGEISDIITVRRNVPASASVSVWSARLVADVDEWREE